MELLIKLFLSLILASIIWLERELNNQPAWFRTHILICVWSTLLMILSMEVALLPWYINGDPWRIAAQVVTWIWFIWAGTIMKTWFNTKGLTTAANIWVTSAIGLVVGAGLYWIAIVATLLILFNLTIITKIKKRLVRQYRYCDIKIEFKKNKESEKIEWERKIIEKINRIPMNTLTKDIIEDKKNITIKIISKINRDIDLTRIHETLRKIDKTLKISIAENIK